MTINEIDNTQEINRPQLKKMLNESKIDGDKIMQTLAQQLKKEALNEEKIRTAKELIKRGVDTDIIEGATGLSREELAKLASKDQ